MILRYRGAHVGRGVRLDGNIRVFTPKAISFETECEILRNTTIDGKRGAGLVGITIGPRVRIKENVWIASYGGKVEIGLGVLVGRNSVIHGHGGVSIGPYSMIAPGCMIYSSNHVTWLGGTYESQGFIRKATVIGENVWLGAGVIVLAGAVIPDNTIVAAGAVVRSELESGFLYGGNPCRKICSLDDIGGEEGGSVEHWAGLPFGFPDSEPNQRSLRS